jgi:hypothetical protein
MSARLQQAPAQYSKGSEQEFRNEMERRDAEAHKKGRHLDLGGSDYYVILTSSNGTRYSVTVSDAGALVVTAL